ncbi:MAG: chromate transporter [Clostridiaceae bacterium]|nr:chromate transporter [Clostridiaceae bacterium]
MEKQNKPVNKASIEYKNISLIKLFFIILKINTFTFGGGYTIIPVLSDEFVFNHKLISKEEMSEIVTIAQSAPGPMVVNASTLIGYRLRGVKGLFIAVFASVLPCLIIISILYYVYNSISDNRWVKSALSVMSGVISGVLIVTTFNMIKSNLKEYPIFSIGMMVVSFLVGLLTNINTGIIVLFSALIGIAIFSLLKSSQIK